MKIAHSFWRNEFGSFQVITFLFSPNNKNFSISSLLAIWCSCYIPNTKLILQWHPYVGQFLLSLGKQSRKEGTTFTRSSKTHSSALFLFVLQNPPTSNCLVWNSIGTTVEINQSSTCLPCKLHPHVPYVIAKYKAIKCMGLKWWE